MKFATLILALIGAASAGYIGPAVIPAVNTYSAPFVSAYAAPYAAPYASPFAPVVRSAYYAAPSPTLVRSAYSYPGVSTYSAVVPAAVAPGAVTIEAWKKKAAA